MPDWNTVIDSFCIESADLDLLVKLIRSRGTPCTTDVLLHYLLEWKLAESESESLDLKELPVDAVIYQAAGDYRVHQRIFIASEGRMGVVQAREPLSYATSEDDGRTTVWRQCQRIEVRLEDGTLKRLMCAAPFIERVLMANGGLGDVLELRGQQLRDSLKHSLRHDTHRRFVSFEGEWFLRELLIADDEHTVKRVEDLLLRRATPVSASDIASALFGDASDPVVIFSLGVLLNSQPTRFRRLRESDSRSLWSVLDKRMGLSPAARRAVPPVQRRLVETDPRAVRTGDPGRPRTEIDTRRRQRVELTIPVGYPESETLPINPHTAAVFPEGSGDIPLVFIDPRSGSRLEGGLSHDEGQCWGLGDWFRAYEIHPGARITIERTEDESVLKVDYVPATRPVTYRLLALRWEAGRLTCSTREFTPLYEVNPEIHQCSTILEDPGALWAEPTDAMFDIICYIFPVLAQGDADGAVHYKTISSAVSYIRRCVPRTVWALLSMHRCFQEARGRPGFWQFDRDKVAGLEETEILRNASLPGLIALENEAQAMLTKLSVLERQVRDQTARLQAVRGA